MSRRSIVAVGLTLACASDPKPVTQLPTGRVDPPSRSAPESNPPLFVGDMDEDGIADDVDQCPSERETYQGIDDEDGCRDIAGSSGVDCDFVLRKLSLRDVHFRSGDHQLDDDGQREVEDLIDFMWSVPDAAITIAGHSDSHEAPRSRQRLSELRAESIRQVMIASGIDGGRITTVGLADRFPIDAGHSAQSRASNRRVEVHSIDGPLCPELGDGGASARTLELDQRE